MTLWPWPLTFWPWSVVIHGGSRGQSLYQVWKSYGYLELWVLTSPLGCHWQCICSQCTCAAISRDLCAEGKFFPHIFEISDPDLPILYTTFTALRLREMKLSTKTVSCPVLKTTWLSVHAQNHVSLARCRKYFTTVVLGDRDFPLTTSNFGSLAAFRAILAIFSLCMHKNGYLWTSG